MATRFSIRRLSARTYFGGFSSLEMVVVICVICILFVIALNRLKGVQAGAEKVAMERVVSVIQSAVAMRAAEYIMMGKREALKTLEASNPMNVLSQVPVNYVGAISGENDSIIEDGQWYFDKTANQLVYQVRHKEFFRAAGLVKARARFALKVKYIDQNNNDLYEPDIDRFKGITLAKVNHYEWLIKAKTLDDVQNLVVQPSDF